jgi:hypothetical protein
MRENDMTEAGGTMRSIPDMISALRVLASNLRCLDSGSGEAALFDDAANYIEGATGSLREHMALCRQMRDAGRVLHNAACAAVGSLKPSDYKRGSLAIACQDWRTAIKDSANG